MHNIMNNKTGAFVSALLHTVEYGKACCFVTDGNVVLKNMKDVYGIDMDEFSVLDASPRKEFEMNTTYKIGKSGYGTDAWALRWPLSGGAAGMWSIRWQVPGRARTGEAICVVDDFGQLVQVFA